MGKITSPFRTIDLTPTLTHTSQVEAQVTLGQIRGEKVALPTLPGHLHVWSGQTRSFHVIVHRVLTHHFSLVVLTFARLIGKAILVFFFTDYTKHISFQHCELSSKSNA